MASARRMWVASWVLALSGCGLLLETDPSASDAADGGRRMRDAARSPDAAPPEDGSTGDDGGRDAIDGRVGGVDGGPLVARCVEAETYVEPEAYAGVLDVVSRGDEVALAFHQAVDRMAVRRLDASLTPLGPLAPWDGAVDPLRLTVSESGYVLLSTYAGIVTMADPFTGGPLGRTTLDVGAAGLSRGDATAPPTAILFGPEAIGPILFEVRSSSVTLTPVATIVPTGEVLDARMERAPVDDAWVVAYVDSADVHVVAVNRMGSSIVAGPVGLGTTPSPTAIRPDLSLAVSGRRAAISVRRLIGGAVGTDVVAFDTSLAIARPPEMTGVPPLAAAVASTDGAPTFGVAYVLGADLYFSLVSWSDLSILDTLLLTTPTTGDVLDLEAEPTPGNYLIARKPRTTPPTTLLRIHCT